MPLTKCATTVAAVLLFSLGVFAARADPLPEPAVTYRAQGAMSFEGSMVPHAIWYDHDKIRLEFVTNGERQIVIMRKDLGRMYLFVEEAPEGMDMPLDPARVSPQGAFIDLMLTAEGTEALAGMEAVRYRVEGHDVLGHVTAGRIWLTEEGIMLRSETTTVIGDTRNTTLIVFSEVAIGPLPGNLFEVPEGVHLMTLN